MCFFAVVSLIAQHDQRHGLPTLILSLSLINQNDALKLDLAVFSLIKIVYLPRVYQICVMSGSLSVCSESIDKGNHYV